MMDTGATFSECRTWRYTLWRRWGTGEHVVFIGLNPSTADEHQDDPTMRRCIRFARDWGFDGFVMLNLFATRTPHPRVMAARLSEGVDIVGPENDEHIAEEVRRADLVVCAWGACTRQHEANRALHVERAIRRAGVVPHILGRTKSGRPRHPLYMPAATQPVAWEVR